MILRIISFHAPLFILGRISFWIVGLKHEFVKNKSKTKMFGDLKVNLKKETNQ